MESLDQFLRSYAVLSKTADAPQIARYGSESYIFVGGYPMRRQDFLVLSTRAIFGLTTPMSAGQWKFINEQVRHTCKDLNVPLKENHEAELVVEALKDYYGMREGKYVPSNVVQKMTIMDSQLAELEKTEEA